MSMAKWSLDGARRIAWAAVGVIVMTCPAMVGAAPVEVAVRSEIDLELGHLGKGRVGECRREALTA